MASRFWYTCTSETLSTSATHNFRRKNQMQGEVITLPDEHISSKDITLNPSKGTLLSLLLAIHGESEVVGHEIHKACHIASTSCCCSSQRCWRGCERSCRRWCSCSCRHSCHLFPSPSPSLLAFCVPFCLSQTADEMLCLCPIEAFAVLPSPGSNSRNLLQNMLWRWFATPQSIEECVNY